MALQKPSNFNQQQQRQQPIQVNQHQILPHSTKNQNNKPLQFEFTLQYQKGQQEDDEELDQEPYTPLDVSYQSNNQQKKRYEVSPSPIRNAQQSQYNNQVNPNKLETPNFSARAHQQSKNHVQAEVEEGECALDDPEEDRNHIVLNGRKAFKGNWRSPNDYQTPLSLATDNHIGQKQNYQILNSRNLQVASSQQNFTYNQTDQTSVFLQDSPTNQELEFINSQIRAKMPNSTKNINHKNFQRQITYQTVLSKQSSPTSRNGDYQRYIQSQSKQLIRPQKIMESQKNQSQLHRALVQQNTLRPPTISQNKQISKQQYQSNTSNNNTPRNELANIRNQSKSPISRSQLNLQSNLKIPNSSKNRQQKLQVNQLNKSDFADISQQTHTTNGVNTTAKKLDLDGFFNRLQSDIDKRKQSNERRAKQVKDFQEFEHNKNEQKLLQNYKNPIERLPYDKERQNQRQQEYEKIKLMKEQEIIEKQKFKMNDKSKKILELRDLRDQSQSQMDINSGGQKSNMQKSIRTDISKHDQRSKSKKYQALSEKQSPRINSNTQMILHHKFLTEWQSVLKNLGLRNLEDINFEQYYQIIQQLKFLKKFTPEQKSQEISQNQLLKELYNELQGNSGRRTIVKDSLLKTSVLQHIIMRLLNSMPPNDTLSSKEQQKNNAYLAQLFYYNRQDTGKKVDEDSQTTATDEESKNGQNSNQQNLQNQQKSYDMLKLKYGMFLTNREQNKINEKYIQVQLKHQEILPTFTPQINTKSSNLVDKMIKESEKFDKQQSQKPIEKEIQQKKQ
eukprot:403374613